MFIRRRHGCYREVLGRSSEVVPADLDSGVVSSKDVSLRNPQIKVVPLQAAAGGGMEG